MLVVGSQAPTCRGLGGSLAPSAARSVGVGLGTQGEGGTRRLASFVSLSCGSQAGVAAFGTVAESLGFPEPSLASFDRNRGSIAAPIRDEAPDRPAQAIRVRGW